MTRSAFVLELFPFALTATLDIMELKTLKGLALHDILTEIHLFVHRGSSRILQFRSRQKGACFTVKVVREGTWGFIFEAKKKQE